MAETKRATDRQIAYMEVLFNDLTFDRKMRNVWLSQEFNREIKYLDEISTKEASSVIDRLKEIKNGQ